MDKRKCGTCQYWGGVGDGDEAGCCAAYPQSIRDRMADECIDEPTMGPNDCEGCPVWRPADDELYVDAMDMIFIMRGFVETARPLANDAYHLLRDLRSAHSKWWDNDMAERVDIMLALLTDFHDSLCMDKGTLPGKGKD